MHESTEKTTNGRNRILSVEFELEPWAATIFVFSRPGLAFTAPPATVHCLASSQRSLTSPRKGTTSFPSTKTERCRPRLAPQCLHSPSNTIFSDFLRFLCARKNGDFSRKCRGHHTMTARSAARTASPTTLSRENVVFL